MSWRRHRTLWLLPVLVVGCSAIFGGDGALLEFTATAVPWDAVVPHLVTTEPGAVIIEGPFPIPCAGPAPMGELKHRGRELALRVSWDAGDLCFTAWALFRYAAQITRLDPGRYRVVVEHEVNGSAQVVLVREVEVP